MWLRINLGEPMENAWHYSDVIKGGMASQLIGVSTACSTFVKAQIKESIKTPRHWPLSGKFTDDRWIPRTKASYAENVRNWWRHRGPEGVHASHTTDLPWKLHK